MWHDLRLAARLLAKDSRFTVTAVLVLTIGMSATITTFTILNGVFLRDLPFATPDRIVSVGLRHLPEGPTDNLSLPDLRDLQASVRLFDGIGAADQGSMDLADEERAAERLVGAYVSAGMFSLIGRQPILGRDFTTADDRPGAPPTVLVGHGVWQRRYGGDPDLVGRTVRVNGVPTTVIGVMPEGFGFPVNAELWQPLAVRGDDPDRRGARNVDAFGRLAEGVTIEQAEADLARVLAELARDFPETNANLAPFVRPFRDVSTSGPIRAVFAGLVGSVVFLLLVACANVANLLLARGASRAREIALRLSLGATRGQIVRQLLIESLLLALLGGVTGLLAAAYGIRVFQAAISGTGEPYWMAFPFDPRVFAFFAVACLGTAVLCGLAPARHAAAVGLRDKLGEAGRAATDALRARRLADGFVVLQLALSLTLLTGAGLMMRNVIERARVDVGVDTAGLMRAEVVLPEQRYPTVDERRRFYRRLGERLGATPGMQAGIASAAPLGGGARGRVAIEGRARDATADLPIAFSIAIGPGYLETLGVSPERGREFSEAEEVAPGGIALVNERFADMHFPGGPVRGQVFRLLSLTPGEPGTDPLTIVGIVPNVRQARGGAAASDLRSPDPVIYVPYAAGAPPTATIVVRSNAEAGAVAAFLRDAVRAVDPDVPVSGVMSLDEHMAQELSVLTTFGSMFSTFAVAALLLATIGLYAVTSYAVARRTRELGIRLALGAGARHVWWIVARRAVLQLSAGLTLGLVGALVTGQILQAVMSSIDGRDPLILIGVPALMTIVALTTCAWPTRRALRVDPVTVLRAE